MSQWTHVAGIVRVDSILEMLSSAFDVEFILGGSFGNPPGGSEGNIDIHCQNTRENNSVSWGHVAIWGDLRDFDDVMRIREWFLSSLQRMVNQHLLIRDAVLCVDKEGGEGLLFRATMAPNFGEAIRGNGPVMKVLLQDLITHPDGVQ